MDLKYVIAALIAVLFCLTLFGLHQYKAHNRLWGLNLVTYLVIPLAALATLGYLTKLSGEFLAFLAVSFGLGIILTWLTAVWLPARWRGNWRERLCLSLAFAFFCGPFVDGGGN